VPSAQVAGTDETNDEICQIADGSLEEIHHPPQVAGKVVSFTLNICMSVNILKSMLHADFCLSCPTLCEHLENWQRHPRLGSNGQFIFQAEFVFEWPFAISTFVSHGQRVRRRRFYRFLLTTQFTFAVPFC
jgi:hypothetical protein